MSTVKLLIIDPQKDFCDPDGKLSVAGADKDCERLADMITRCASKIDDISVTLDSHRVLHIAHPIWWKDPQTGQHPDPFTLITVDDVVSKNPKWIATNPGYQSRSEEYVQTLAKNGRYILCIWPPHCLIGSKGYAIQDQVFEALCGWESSFAVVNYVTKGSNIFTEHYSAIQADVPDPGDASTNLNTGLIQWNQEADLIGITGQALSHCVKCTIEDVINQFGEKNVKKFVLIEDTSSSVTGCESMGEDFVEMLTSLGGQVCKSDEFLT